MQATVASPGFLFETLYMADPESLSVMYTVPAAKVLPLLSVVLEKAENVAHPAMLPTTPRSRSVRSIFWRKVRIGFSLWGWVRGEWPSRLSAGPGSRDLPLQEV